MGVGEGRGRGGGGQVGLGCEHQVSAGSVRIGVVCVGRSGVLVLKQGSARQAGLLFRRKLVITMVLTEQR